MAKPANIELLNDLDVEAENLAKKLGKKAKRLNRKLDPRDYWPKPYYSNVHIFGSGVRRVFIGLNPGGNRHSKKIYDKYGYAKKIWSDRRLSFNSYLDERWGKATDGAHRKGHAPLQIAAQRVFEAMYGDDWECILRDTPCFNLIPVSSEAPKVCGDPKRNGKLDSELKEIWHKESA